MGEKITVLKRFSKRQTFEPIAESRNTLELKDQLDALDIETLGDFPILIMSGKDGKFDIYSVVREKNVPN